MMCFKAEFENAFIERKTERSRVPGNIYGKLLHRTVAVTGKNVRI